MRIILLGVFVNLIYTSNFGQTKLDFESFKQRVLAYHPVVKKAQNQVKIGSNELLKAKGTLDPKFTSDVTGKQFNSKNYFQLSNTGLKIPTWLGIDFKAGYEQNRGVFVSSEHATPGSGLWYLGVDVPLGQGLLFDERRATIQTAKVFEKNSLNDQELMINDVLLDAYSSYWSWYEAYQKLNIAEEGYQFALIRFQGVKQSALLGDVPFIDTVEAKIQLESRNFELTQAQYEYQNSKTVLNLYLWTDEYIPLELEETTIPSIDTQRKYVVGSLKLRMTDVSSDSLPLVLSSIYKLEQLKIEEKWKREQLKPQLNVSYNPISQPVGNDPFQNFSTSNYKFGIAASMPLFLRKERGNLAQTRLKVENTKLDIAYKINEIQQKETYLRNELYRVYEQIDIQQSLVINTKALRDSEQIRFDIGESSLFLVNSRELTYLQYKSKLVELEAKMKVIEAKWLWIFSELD